MLWQETVTALISGVLTVNNQTTADSNPSSLHKPLDQPNHPLQTMYHGHQWAHYANLTGFRYQMCVNL